MDNDNLLIICRVCGRKVLMHNMRLDDDKENMICNDCYKKKASGIQPTSVLGKKAVENNPYEPSRHKVAKTKSEKMLRYICTSCKYKFSRKESQHVEKCPYCGKNSIVLDTQLGADKLINDSMDRKFEW
jgi:predicted RNA-binding Zn-ribbon protein involved in translation (DUF1610 family)